MKFDRQEASFSHTQELAIPTENTTFSDNEAFSLRNSIGWFGLGFSLYIAIVTVNLTAGFLYTRSISNFDSAECNLFCPMFFNCRNILGDYANGDFQISTMVCAALIVDWTDLYDARLA